MASTHQGRLMLIAGAASVILGMVSSGLPPGYILPFEGTVNITCGPGGGSHRAYRNLDTTEAMDFQATDRSEFLVRAVAGGTAHVDVVPDFGLVVRISHPDGLQSFYAHLSRVLVRDGQADIKPGDPIAYTGHSGTGGAGNHLHFEVRMGAGGPGRSNVYSGHAIPISDDPRIHYNPDGTLYRKGTATGEPYSYRGARAGPTRTPAGSLDWIPDYAIACDVPIGAWGTCYDPHTGQTAACGVFGIDPETGLNLNGHQVCAQEGKTCRYVTPDGGVVCDPQP